MEHVVTDLDNQIADVEREIAEVSRSIRTLKGKAKAHAIGLRSLLVRQHEQLVRQVQWATVGAAKPGEVL